MATRKPIIPGQRFSRLVVIEKTSLKTGSSYKWRCKCDCGKEALVISVRLKNGRSRSCGCLNHEETSRRRFKHGHAIGMKSTEYIIWRSMIRRCYSEKDKCYRNYGGRGITVCKRWRESFEKFLSDMGHRPPGLSIDRINNAEGYSPDNCRWATQLEQQRNKTSNFKITFMGSTRCATEWENIIGINCSTIKWRIRKGWSVERTFTTLP